MRRRVGLGALGAVVVTAALLIGVQLAPAAERREGDEARPGLTSLEMVGRADQNGPSIVIFGYVTHLRGVDDAALFAAATRNETTARITFSGSTTISQTFTVQAPPNPPSLFDSDSTGTLTFFFTETPGARSFTTPGSFATGTPVATNTLRFQDIVAALVPIDPTQGVVDSHGELCQQSAVGFRLNGELQRIGRPGLLHDVSTHGWTTRTSPSPPQSFTHFGGRTSPLADGRC